MALPYQHINDSKKEQVRNMFNNIASRYDFLNHFLSFNIDRLWRKKAIRSLKKYNPQLLLDVATGTGDMAFESLKLNPIQVTGIDLAEGMLQVARQKAAVRNLADKMVFILGDSEQLPFDSNTFDAITVAFGVRNFEHLTTGLSEMFRVLKPGGQVVILEFSKPRSFPVKQLYSFYSKQLLPVLGGLVSKDRSAYTYLPVSVSEFPDGSDFVNILVSVGFTDCKAQALTFGIASLYTGRKS